MPQVSWTMNILYMNQGNGKRVDTRIIHPEKQLFRPGRFELSMWLSQICTLSTGPNSFEAFLKIRIWFLIRMGSVKK